MCGLAGIVRLAPAAPAIDRDELVRTTRAMARRGPDGEGFWFEPRGRAAFGHRRLAILDPSPAGAQPMAGATSSPAAPETRTWLVLNGEIYNFRALRGELTAQGERFRSGSDTEVILALWRRERESMLGRLRGMYALALFDEGTGEVLLARDPCGIKPLYLAIDGGVLRFASQVKALDVGGGIERAVEPAAVAGFLAWGSVPEPWTLRRGVRALPAGGYLLARTDGSSLRPEPVGPAPSPRAPVAEPQALLEDSIRAHLVSDVPVALFLSAGLDSTLVAALAARAAREAGEPPPRAFTLAFDRLVGTPLDEAPLAAATAAALGLPHEVRTVGRAEFLDLWDGALAAMDQPSIDGFNTYVVARAAHQDGIKVALSGLGGDELFGGYSSFRTVPRLARLGALARLVPRPALAALGRRRGQPKLPGLGRTGAGLAGAYRLHRGLFLPDEIAALVGAEAARQGLAACDPLADALRALAPRGRDGGADAWTAVHRLESALYMRNQLLRDSDWAAMAHSLELRVPLVDAWLEAGFAARGFEPAKSRGKRALVAEVLARVAPELPPAVLARPKSGFYMPVMEWLDPGTTAHRQGERSRRLALRVLAAFGIEIGR